MHITIQGRMSVKQSWPLEIRLYIYINKNKKTMVVYPSVDLTSGINKCP